MGVFHHRILTPIKGNFQGASSASEPHPIPATSPSPLTPKSGRIGPIQVSPAPQPPSPPELASQTLQGLLVGGRDCLLLAQG